MANKQVETVREIIYLSYANLSMAHTAVVRRQEKYEAFNFMIRARLLRGLTDGTMKMRTLFDDEKIKLEVGNMCNYCGSSENLSLDHIFPVKYGGTDVGDNLIYACRACNSSKGKKDLMEWMVSRGRFLPLMVIRRYLKLMYNYCVEHDLLDRQIRDVREMALPFRVDLLPVAFPNPQELTLNIAAR